MHGGYAACQFVEHQQHAVVVAWFEVDDTQLPDPIQIIRYLGCVRPADGERSRCLVRIVARQKACVVATGAATNQNKNKKEVSFHDVVFVMFILQ